MQNLRLCSWIYWIHVLQLRKTNACMGCVSSFTSLGSLPPWFHIRKSIWFSMCREWPHNILETTMPGPNNFHCWVTSCVTPLNLNSKVPNRTYFRRLVLAIERTTLKGSQTLGSVQEFYAEFVECIGRKSIIICALQEDTSKYYVILRNIVKNG